MAGERRVRERERRRQKIDESAKVYQNVHKNVKKWSKSDSLPSSPTPEMLKLGRKSQTLSPSADCVFDDPEVLEEPQPKQKDTGVTDVLKRLSISLRPLPAFESEGEPYTEEGSAMDGKVAQALSVGSHNGSDNPTSESDNISKSERYSQRRFKGYGSKMEALLLAINAIHDRVGTDEDQSDFETLKNIIQSPEAKKAIEVDEMMRGLIHGDSGRPRPVDKHLIPSAVLVGTA